MGRVSPVAAGQIVPSPCRPRRARFLPAWRLLLRLSELPETLAHISARCLHHST